MIDRETGSFRFEGGEIGPAAPDGVRIREAADPRGRPVLIGAHHVGERLVGIDLRYAIRRAVADVNGNDDWEHARKDYHDAIVREWFASSVHDLMYAPPPQPGPLVFRFAWGSVRSDVFGGDRGALIEVRYADAAT